MKVLDCFVWLQPRSVFDWTAALVEDSSFWAEALRISFAFVSNDLAAHHFSTFAAVFSVAVLPLLVLPQVWNLLFLFAGSHFDHLKSRVPLVHTALHYRQILVFLELRVTWPSSCDNYSKRSYPNTEEKNAG